MPKKAVTNENAAEQQEQNVVVEESEKLEEALAETEASIEGSENIESDGSNDAEFEENSNEETDVEDEELERYAIEAAETTQINELNSALASESTESEEDEEANYEGADEIEVEKSSVASVETDTDNDEATQQVATQVLTPEMRNLFAGAVYRSTQLNKPNVLTGTLTGVSLTKYGTYATVSYNGKGANDYGSASVYIPYELMGEKDQKELERTQRKINRKRGIVRTPKELLSQVERMKYSTLYNMLGAKIDFVPVFYDPSTNFIRGDRARAMKARRRNYTHHGGRVPRIVEGDTVRARVVRVGPGGVIVEASGHEQKLTLREISALAVDIYNDIKVGDTLPVVVRSTMNGNIRLIGKAAIASNISRLIHEYARGSSVFAKILSIDSNGNYHLKMPNGCRGTVFFNKATLSNNSNNKKDAPKVGDNIKVVVTGYSSTDDVVKCTLTNGRL